MKINFKLKKKDQISERITNKTLDEKRKNILQSAKKFKYPVQYERHKIVINATLIVICLFMILSGFVYYKLYKQKSTSEFLYKITRIIPLPIGEIDGQPILYRDYLAQYLSSVHYYTEKEGRSLNTKDGQQVIENFKKQAFENSARIALARKISNKNNIKITKEDIKEDLNRKLSFGNDKMSINSFNKIVNSYYGLNPEEYQQTFIENPLMIQKASLLIDKNANALKNQIELELKSNTDLNNIALKYQNKGVELGDSGLINKNNSDSGRVEKALSLNVGQISDSFLPFSMDGYYFIKLLYKDDEIVRYQTLKVPLNEFETEFSKIKNDNKIKNYIN